MSHVPGYNGFLNEPLEFHHGKITLSDKPRLGVELNVDEIEKVSIQLDWPIGLV